MNGTRIGHCGRRRTKQRAFVCSLVFLSFDSLLFLVFFFVGEDARSLRECGRTAPNKRVSRTRTKEQCETPLKRNQKKKNKKRTKNKRTNERNKGPFLLFFSAENVFVEKKNNLKERNEQ